VGSNKVIKTDCRIIVATNRNLKDEVKKGKFREDLYFRLFGLPIELPPLRERDKDVLVLAKHFITLFCKENDMAEKTLGSDAQKKLLSYSFPGNIRELKSVIDLSVVMSNSPEIGSDDIMLGTDDVLPEVMGEEVTMREYNHRIVDTYLKKYDNNINLVAQKLDISPSTIYRMLKEEKES
jgi:DNA-binding NtrC family response regulator